MTIDGYFNMATDRSDALQGLTPCTDVVAGIKDGCRQARVL